MSVGDWIFLGLAIVTVAGWWTLCLLIANDLSK